MKKTFKQLRLKAVKLLSFLIVGLAFLVFLTPSHPSFAQTVSFTNGDLTGVTLNRPTTLDFGPDNRLYIAQQNGVIYACTIVKSGANSYQVTATETISLVRSIPNHNDNGALNSSVTDRQITGILATGTASNPVLYVSSSDPRIGGGGTGGDTNLDTNSGVISKLTKNGGVWTKVDIVAGLPRSEENHANNGLALDGNTLYVAMGGSTNAGSPSNNFAFLTEYALSAAVLKIDLNQINTQFGGTYILPTLDDPTRTNTSSGVDQNDPFGGNDGRNQAKLVAGGPVQIHSPGYRNIYDLVITATPGKSGRMYTIDNGANGGWGGHPQNEGGGSVTNQYVTGEPGSNGPGPNDAKVNNLDNLHYVSGPNFGPIYGGHPNPIRANPSGAGLYWYDNSTGIAHFELNPTPDWPPVPISMANPVEGDFRNPGVNDGALYTWGSSTNGMAEYRSFAFGGAMTGDLLAASFDGRVYRIQLSSDGSSVTNVSPLFSNFATTPLDLTTQADNEIFPGTIWVADYSGNKLTFFEPVDQFENWSNVSYADNTSPLARHENGFVEVGGNFYLIGGRGNKTVGIYNPVTKVWTSGPQPPIPLHHFQAVVFQNKIYVVCAFTGGFPNETPTDKIYIYDTQTNTWSDGPSIPAARRRGAAGVVLYQNKFYIAGGITNGHVDGWVNWMDRFDPTAGEWTQLTDAPRTRDHFHAALINGKIYLAGGRRSGDGGLGATVSEVDVYDIEKNSWTSPTQIPTPRAGAGVTVNNNQLIIVGGEISQQSTALATVESYNPATNTWQTKPPMNIGRHGTQLINYGGRLFIAAGSSMQGGSGENNTMSSANYGTTCSGANNASLDEDIDGYNNADEIANGTDPCSPSSRPEDLDGDYISNLNDPDDDNDGISDILDKFALDPSNGQNTSMPINYPFLNGDPGLGLFGVGFTGLMNNGTTSYHDQFDPTHPDLIVGGAVGLVSIPANGNTALSNNQEYAFQLGVNINQSTPPFIIHSRLLGAPFFGGQALASQSEGVYFGTGDQNNYLKFVLHANQGNPGFQILSEQNGTVVVNQIIPVSGILNSGELEILMRVDPSNGQVKFFYKTSANGNQIEVGQPYTVGGNILNVLQSSTQALAVGLIATSENTDEYSAIWDFLKIVPENAQTQLSEVARINSGGPAVQTGGKSWSADQYFSGGSVYTKTTAINSTTDDVLYQSERYGNFSYAIPVPQSGQYLVEFHLAEIYWQNPGQRVFNIDVENGKFTQSNIDLVAQFGTSTAGVIQVPNINVADSVLNITFSTVVNNAKISGIVVYQNTSSSTSSNPPFVISPYPTQVIPVTQTSLNVPLDQIFNDDGGVNNLTFQVKSISNPALITNTQINGTQLQFTFASTTGTTNVVLRATDGDNGFVESSFQIERTNGLTQVARINSGGPAVQTGGKSWSADQYFSGGSVYTKTTAINGTTDDVLYQSERYGNFSYAIPVPQSGQYLVEFHFAEIYWQNPGQRVFNVDVENGKFTQSNIDPVALFGAATAGVIQAPNINVTDGVLNIAFSTVVNNAKVSGIVVYQNTSSSSNPPFVISPYPTQVIPVTQTGLTVPLDKIFNDDGGVNNLTFQVKSISNPTLIANTQINGTQLQFSFTSTTGTTNVVLRAIDGDNGFVESSFQIERTNGLTQVARINSGGPAIQTGGKSWSADQYFSGGSVYTKAAAINGTTDDVLYQSERYGNFSYAIPVPQSGQYVVEFHFAEIYWQNPGQRVFNINVENGQFTQSNVDLVAQFGAATAGVIQAPNINVTDGVLNITFTKVVDNVKISGIVVSRQTTAISTVVISNNAPILITPKNKILKEGEFWSFQLEASDVDAGDTLTFATQDLPASLMLDPSTGIISGTVEASAGEYPVELSVSDLAGATDSARFIITITEASDSIPSANPDKEKEEEEAIHETPSEDIIVFPNPAKSEFTVKIDVKENSHWKFLLFNATGIQISLGDLSLQEGVQWIQFKLARENISPGLYYLNVRSSKTNKILKLAIE